MLHLQVPEVLNCSLLKAVPGLVLGSCDHDRAIGPGWGTSASLPWKTEMQIILKTQALNGSYKLCWGRSSQNKAKKH